MKKYKVLKIFLIAISSIILYSLIPLLLVLLLCFGFNDKYEVTTDIDKYEDVIGYKAKDKYKDKWNMDEKIFPKSIKNLDVKDFKMVYYNPFDKQYLSYLVVNYQKDEYYIEVERLKKYGIKKYKGYYGVTGFTNYELLSMNSDPYYGFIYALGDGENRIIYVELIFCNYYMDIKYNKQIPSKYLPDGFDATIDNKYQKKMLNE